MDVTNIVLEKDLFAVRNLELDLYEEYAPYISKLYVSLDVPYGWLGLVRQIFELIESRGATDVRVQQIKQKAGRLVFYYEGGDQDLYELIEVFEKKSIVTCEVCGKDAPLDPKVQGVRLARCPAHVKTTIEPLTTQHKRAIDTRFGKISKKFGKEVE